jgi:hypothetical protein
MSDDGKGAANESLADRFAPQTPFGEATVPDDVPGFLATPRGQPEFGIEFVWRDGRIMTVEYGHLIYATLEAGGGVVIHFSRLRVKLTGRNLAPLLRRLKDHRLACVAEVVEAHDAVLQEESAVYQIAVEFD